MTDCLDYPAACRLFQVIRDEPRCTDPDCCPKENPVHNPYLVIKLSVGILIAAIMTAFVLTMVIGL